MAEENITTSTQETTPTEQPEKTPEQRLEELMVEYAKLKRASDKNASEAAEYRKKYQTTLSEKERADMEKAEAAARDREELETLRRENQISKVEKTYLGLGWLPDEAAKMAVADVDGDFETRLKLMAAVDERKKKAYEAEWLKGRPEAFTGGGSDSAPVSKAEFDKLSYTERVEFKQKYPDMYKAYTK